MDRNEEIIRVLASSVRVMSLQQVARDWWSDTRWGRSRANRTLGELTTAKLLHVRRVLSRPIAPLHATLTVWRPGEAEPDFETLAKQLHRRAMKPAHMLTIVFAARRSVALFSPGAMPTIKLTQMTHDLHVSEVFLHYRRRGQQTAWLSEDHLPSDWPLRQRPDAVLCDHGGEIVHAVEYGGDYPAKRLIELHRGFSEIELSYEIW